MSREAIGENGAILGSNEYWSRVNRSTFLGGLMGQSAETDYRGLLHEVGNRAGDAIEEIYEDLQEHRPQLIGIPADRRSALAKQVQGLYDVCRRGNSVARHSDDCLSMLQLHGFFGNSFSDEESVQNAIRKIKNSSDFSAGECVDLLEKAADWGISFAAEYNEKKREFLQDIAQGKDKDFLQEVVESYKSSGGTADTRGKCGDSIGSSDYLMYMEHVVFQRELPVMSSARWGTPNYDALLTDGLEAIAHQLERDLETNERDNNYITDDTAARLKDAVSELAACGVGSGFLSSKIDKLAWFVGGDATKIRQLQGKLNELGVGGHLTEDGVYGRETLAAWEKFLSRLEHGTVPTLAWIDPLQSNLTGITIGSTTEGSALGINNALISSSEQRFAHIDGPHLGQSLKIPGVRKRKPIDFNHINVDKVPDTNWFYNQFQNRLNHYELSDDAYNAVKDLKNFGKKVRIAGKVLLVAGVALDALELGTAIDADVKDADRKLGKKTLSTAASIGGSWAGAALGAKLGALAGAATGPAAPIAVPVLSLAGGIGGAFGGDALGKWMVDITCVED